MYANIILIDMQYYTRCIAILEKKIIPTNDNKHATLILYYKRQNVP